jgi:hypothetical protein
MGEGKCLPDVIRDREFDIWQRLSGSDLYECLLPGEEKARAYFEEVCATFGPVQVPEWHDL